MTVEWLSANRILQAVATRCAGLTIPPTLLVDAAMADSAIEHLTTQWLMATGLDVDRVIVEGPGDLHTVLTLADRIRSAPLVIGLGGGALLDQAKLATVVSANTRAHLTVPQRSGLVVLPPEAHRKTPLIAIPTTLGTGSEVSGVACLRYPDGKRLVGGAALSPEASVLDPIATRSLPGMLIQEGVLEALSRVASPYIADHRDLPTEDRLAEVIVGRLAQCGYEASAALLGSGEVAGGLRLEIAKLSGFSHGRWLYRGGDPYAVKGWMIANELSHALGVRKMTAVAALLPPLWSATLSGERRLGSARRLIRIWERIRAIAPRALPEDPVAGIATLIADWRVATRIEVTSAQLDTIAQRAVRAWGAGLPMLGGLDASWIRRLLAETTVRK